MVISKKPSRFFVRTLSNINDHKTSSEKSSQLHESLHPLLNSERTDLARFADAAEKVRADSRNAESIRNTAKKLRDKLVASAEAIKAVSNASAELQNEFNRLGIELQFGDTSFVSSSSASGANTPNCEKNESESFVSLLGDELKRLSGGKVTPSPSTRGVINELNTLQLKNRLAAFLDDGDDNEKAEETTSAGPWSSSILQEEQVPENPVDDVQLLLYLVKTSEKMQMLMTSRFDGLSENMESSVCEEWLKYVKGPVRDSRYEGHDFMRLYGQYHDAVRNLNSMARSQPTADCEDASPADDIEVHSGASISPNSKARKQQMITRFNVSGNKQLDAKKFRLLQDAVLESKEALLEKADVSLSKFAETEMEWEVGVFPGQLLNYMKQMKAYFKAGMEACNELMPEDLVILLEKSLKKRLDQRKAAVGGAFEELFSTPLASPVPLSDLVTLHATSRPSSMASEEKLAELAFSSAPKFPPPAFSPPAPPPPLPPKLPPKPKSAMQAPTPPASPVRRNLIDVPKCLCLETRVLLQSIAEPRLQLLYRIFGSDESPIYRRSAAMIKSLKSDSAVVPSPIDVDVAVSPSSYDGIQRCIQLINECNRIPEWVEMLLSEWAEEVPLVDAEDLKQGRVAWKQFDGSLYVEQDRRASFVRTVQYHIIWAVGKHYVQKCVREISELVSSSQTSEQSDDFWLELMRKVIKCIFGHRGLISKPFRRVLEQFSKVLISSDTDFEPLSMHRTLSMVIFSQCLFPALIKMPQLISFWEARPSSSFLRSSTLSSPIESSDSYNEIAMRVHFVLQSTLNVVLDYPPTHSGNDFDDIRFLPLAQVLADENGGAFGDFFGAIAKPVPNDIVPTPIIQDSWMIEAWAQEWLTMYSDD